MLGVRMLEDTFRTEHLLVTLTEELNLFLLVGVTVLDATTFFCCSRGATS